MTDLYEALHRDVLDYGIVSGPHGDEDGFRSGLNRLASVVADVEIATGEGTVTDPPHLTVHVFTSKTVATWAWKPIEGSTVLVRSRRELLSIQLDDAPPDGRHAYTLVYPWGTVAIRERAGSSVAREMLLSFVDDLGLGGTEGS